jgi:amino acid transporter, AAT family
MANSQGIGELTTPERSDYLPETGLHRGLTERQLSMIAIGGAIGVGLFLGTNISIRLAGPGLILSYLLGAVIALVVAYAIAEMAVVHPAAGSFGVYAERYLHPWAGFAVRATYGIVQILAIGAEVTAVAIYFAFWFPAVPQWIWVGIASVFLVTLNALQVNRFGEFEYWFALIKVVAIICFIVIGAALIFGVVHRPALGAVNLTQNGGFLPFGWRGVWLALTLVITSYMGIEVIAVTSGEAENPEKSIPKAMRNIVYRLIIFYVLAVAIMLALVPWNKMGTGGLNGSPFVLAFSMVGIPYAASIMNFVVISAALSSANTNLYLSTRMLFSLSRAAYAPAWVGCLSSRGVPLRALAISTGGMLTAIILAFYNPRGAFLLLYGTAVAGMFFVWLVILASHLQFRRAIGARARELPLSVWGYPYSTLFAMFLMAAIAVSTVWVSGLKYSVPTYAMLLLLVTVAYACFRRGT